jgi:polysaccharide chain length determinant protein (PEP-CTERM system associated)
MGEMYHLIVTMAYEVWKKRFYALAVAWVVSVGGWVFVSQIPNQYQSKARILVDAESILRPLMKSMSITNNPYNQILVMRQTLTSRRNMDKLLIKTDLDLTVKTDKEKEDLIKLIQDNVDVSVKGHNLFSISFEHTNPVTAKNIVKALIDIFAEQEINGTRIDGNTALRFLEEQIAIYEERLDSADESRLSFKQKNLVFFQEGGTFFSRMQDSKTAERDTNRLIRESIGQKDILLKQLKTIPKYVTTNFSASGIGENVSSPLSRLVESLNQRLYDYYAGGLKEKHPDIIAIKRQIENVTKRAREEDEEFRKALISGDQKGLNKKSGASRNPVHVELSAKILNIETEIASLQARLIEQEGYSKQLAGLSHRAPEVVAEYARLNRDYNVVKSSYQGFLKNRETMKISMDLETSDRVMFQTIDPPQIAQEPSSPNRILLILGVLVVGLGAGVGVAFVLSQLHSTFSTESKLSDVYGFPVIGSVSIISTDKDAKKRKKSLTIFLSLLIGLLLCAIAAYAGIYFHYNNSLI